MRREGGRREGVEVAEGGEGRREEGGKGLGRGGERRDKGGERRDRKERKEKRGEGGRQERTI
jgi:hypothetical protein